MISERRFFKVPKTVPVKEIIMVLTRKEDIMWPLNISLEGILP